MRIIKINNCIECPYYFVGAKPVGKLYDCCERKRTYASKHIIPEDCPLDTLQTAGFVEVRIQQPTAPCCSVEDSHIPEASTSA